MINDFALCFGFLLVVWLVSKACSLPSLAINTLKIVCASHSTLGGIILNSMIDSTARLTVRNQRSKRLVGTAGRNRFVVIEYGNV